MPNGVSRRELILGPLAWSGAAALGLTTARAVAAEAASGRFLRAAADGDRDAVRHLLDGDPGLLYTRDPRGRTAFALALLGHHQPVAELLRARGYEPDLHESALALDWERFEGLAREAPGRVNGDHPATGPAMVAAALGGAGTSIWHVYAMGGRPDARGASGPSALVAALQHPNLATAELTAASLLGNAASAVVVESGGVTPLHLAAARGSLDLVEMLVRKGALVEARDGAGRTAREQAETAGQGATAALLAHHREIPRDHSTSRRALDAEGRPYAPPDLSHHSILVTSHVVGAAHFDLEETRAQIERHPELAHSIATTSEGAVEGCAHTGRHEIVDFLLGHGAPYSLPTAVMRGDLAWTRRLLSEDALRIHERGPHDFALLWYPVIGGGRLELAELLLDAGAEVERQHFLGTTALHFAALGGQAEMVELLLDRGADPHRVGRKFDPAGQTPLDLAQSRGHEAVAGLLRARG
jgi:ankyrin repeat protein